MFSCLIAFFFWVFTMSAHVEKNLDTAKIECRFEIIGILVTCYKMVLVCEDGCKTLGKMQ